MVFWVHMKSAHLVGCLNYLHSYQDLIPPLRPRLRRRRRGQGAGGGWLLDLSHENDSSSFDQGRVGSESYIYIDDLVR